MNEILKFLLVLVLSSMLDACWTLAIIYTDRKRQNLATIWTGFGYLIASINVIEYVSDPKLIVAVVIGAMIGCYFVVKYLKY